MKFYVLTQNIASEVLLATASTGSCPLNPNVVEMQD